MKRLLTAAGAVLTCAIAQAQLPSDAVGPGEFPGLQLLPAGSVISGITIPRYEGHKVTAYMQVEEMKVISRSVVRLRDILVHLYDDKGYATVATTTGVEYSFKTEMAFSTGKMLLKDARFSAEGSKALYHSGHQRGILIGPVKTTISAAVFNKNKK